MGRSIISYSGAPARFNSNQSFTGLHALGFLIPFNNVFVTATEWDGNRKRRKCSMQSIQPFKSDFQYGGTQVFSGDPSSKFKMDSHGNERQST